MIDAAIIFYRIIFKKKTIEFYSTTLISEIHNKQIQLNFTMHID